MGGVLLKNACSVTWSLRMATGHTPILEVHIPKPSLQQMAAESEDDYSSDEFSSDEEVSTITICMLVACVYRMPLQRRAMA